MAWCDSEYYQNGYLLGRTASIPVAEFAYWEKQAENKVNWKHVTVDVPPDNLKDCVCAVAERIYAQSLAQGAQTGANGAAASPVITGFSNDGYSENYMNTLAAYQNMSKAQVDTEIRAIVTEYLAGTELHNDFIFRGVC